MYKHIAVIALILFAVSPIAVATQHTGQDQQISQSNRFLSAEAQRVIREELDVVQDELQSYQDENFQILDNRISTFIEDSQWKIGLVGAGAGFIAMAIGALLMMRSFKKHSIAQARRSEEEMEQIVQQVQDRVHEQLDSYMQSEWRPQQTPDSMASQYGQAGAEKMSQMNQWQAQSAHRDSWKAPVDVQQDVSSMDRLEDSYAQKRPEWEQPVPEEDYYNQEEYQQEDYYQDEYQGYDENYGDYEQGYDDDYGKMEQWAQDLLEGDDEKDGWL